MLDAEEKLFVAKCSQEWAARKESMAPELAKCDKILSTAKEAHEIALQSASQDRLLFDAGCFYMLIAQHFSLKRPLIIHLK